MSRGEAYAWLAARLHINKDDCHMVNFNIKGCERVKALCDAFIFHQLVEDEAESTLFGWGGQDWNTGK